MQKEIINYQMVTFICKSNPVIVFIILLFFVSTLFFPIIPAYSITTTQAYFDENFAKIRAGNAIFVALPAEP